MRLLFLIPLAKALRSRVTRRKPDVVIGTASPYMLRWWVIPRNKHFNIYLHHFLRRDEDRALHDHPWWSLSFIFEGSYFEHTEKPEPRLEPVLDTDGETHWHGVPVMAPVVTRRDAGAVAWRGATSRHRISLPIERLPRCPMHDCPVRCEECPDEREVPCWTIFITGPKVREWGFWCKGEGRADRFVPWRTFSGSDHNVTGVGSIGAGCGED